MSDCPAPLTPAGCILQDFPHTPLFRARLFGSSFHAQATDGEWRAGVTLWLKSWDQVPAGSLPDNDIELCRLAELARDTKTWKKLKVGALRGWVLCSDGRLYHPVVAEGINNAIEKKAAQRAKTGKARLAALEKRLKDAKTDAERSHVADEIRKLQQTLSQTSKESVTDPATEFKRREGEGKEKGNSSVSDDTDGGAPSPTPPAPPPPAPPPAPTPAPKPPKTPEELAKAELWRAAVSLLDGQGMPEPQARAFIGKLVKDHPHGDTVMTAIRNAVAEQPADARSWLTATCQHLAGERRQPNKQEALEARGQAVVDAWAAQGEADASA